MNTLTVTLEEIADLRNERDAHITLIQDQIDKIAELTRERNDLRIALQHAVYRQHPLAANFCSGCESIQTLTHGPRREDEYP